MRFGNGQDNQAVSAMDDSFNNTESLVVSFDKKTPPVYGWDDYFFFTTYLHKFSPDLEIHDTSDDDLVALIHQLPCFEDDQYYPENNSVLRRIRWMFIAKQARANGDYFLTDDLIGGVS